MSPAALESLRDQLGMTQREMAALLQCDYVGYKRYALGSRPIPPYIERSAAALGFIHASGLVEAYKTQLGCLQR
jgi:transcriptional regulator with XRE-family HTH domain